MGSLSVSIHRGRVPWQGLLLAVALLSFWGLPTTVQLPLLFKNVTEGDNVFLPVRIKVPYATRLKWYRGQGVDEDREIAHLVENEYYHERGPGEGRVIIIYDGSLMLKNITKDDSGIYTALVELPGPNILIGFRQINVYEAVKVPTLLASNTTVMEDKDAVVLTCYTDARSTQWLFNGRNLQLTERMKLSADHRSLTINPVKREDAGTYQCEASNTVRSVESPPLELDVKFE